MALTKCPDCGRDVSDAAPACPGCGRPIKPPKDTEKKGGIGCGSLLVVMGILWLIIILNSPRPQTVGSTIQQATPSATPDHVRIAEDAKAMNARLWRENHRLDDSARAYILKSTLKSGGQRCDSVESQIMAAPGEWRVRCSPGYAYYFKFDAAGTLISATK